MPDHCCSCCRASVHLQWHCLRVQLLRQSPTLQSLWHCPLLWPLWFWRGMQLTEQTKSPVLKLTCFWRKASINVWCSQGSHAPCHNKNQGCFCKSDPPCIHRKQKQQALHQMAPVLPPLTLYNLYTRSVFVLTFRVFKLLRSTIESRTTWFLFWKQWHF